MSTQNIGVCILLLDSLQKKVLLGKRINSYKAGTFGLPGGRLELTETLEACARRELREEVGVEAEKLTYLGVIRELQIDFNFIHFVFVCPTYRGEPKVMEPEKCEGWEFYPFTELPENILSGHKAAIALFLQKNLSNLVDIT